MKLTEIKKQLNLETLQPSYLRDAEGKRANDPRTNQPTKWLRHWDDANRRAIVIHEDVALKIKANPDGITNLAIKDKGMQQPADPTKKPYQCLVVIEHTEADFVF